MVRRLVCVGLVVGLLAACGREPYAPARDDLSVRRDALDATRADLGAAVELSAPRDGAADARPGPPDAAGRTDAAAVEAGDAARRSADTPAEAAGPADGRDDGTGDFGGPVDAWPPPEASSADTGRGPCQRGNFVLEGHVRNVRDLGGIPLAGGHRTACGALFRGSELSELTPAGCVEFAQLGARTIVDLRTDGERAYAPNMACAEHVAATVLAPLPTPAALSPQDYLDVLYSVESVATVFATLGDESAHPVYLHCIYGRDRTGVVAAVILLALGATRDDVLADYELTATTGMRIAPESLRAVLDDIERTGGIEAYLARLGVTAAQLAVLRAHAVAP